MRPAATLHVLGTALLAVAFVVCAVGAYANANSSAEGGADIGAGVLLLLGTIVGTGGVLCAVGAVVAHLVTRRRAGTD